MRNCISSLFLSAGGILALFSFSFAQTDSMVITSYYPSPMGVYSEVRLVPKPAPSALCNASSEGLMYYSSANQQLAVCTNMGGTFEWGLKVGKLGIGTPNPFYKLEVGDISESFNYIRIRSSSTGGGGVMFFDGQGTHSSSVYYEHSTDSMVFQTRNAATAVADRMRLNSSGFLGIGLDMGTGQAINPSHLIELIGGAYCDGTGDWIAGSDRAYKKDIDYNFGYGLKTVERLRPVYYIHKQDKTNKKQIGFIAQDVKEVVPEVVSGVEGSYGLSYGQLTAVLVNAIKEQQKEINDLKQEINGLKQELNGLKAGKSEGVPGS